jgi:hypothetical protein
MVSGRKKCVLCLPVKMFKQGSDFLFGRSAWQMASNFIWGLLLINSVSNKYQGLFTCWACADSALLGKFTLRLKCGY